MAYSLAKNFSNPDRDAKGMFRWWFPDAGAGADESDSIEEQMNSMRDAGFGGVEVALVPHHTVFDPAEYGWGTANWSKVMKKVLKAAKKMPEKFKVDFTITAHWPPSVNTVSPNDEAASQEISHAFRRISGPGLLELPTPPVKTKDRDEKMKADYIFTDIFVAATVAKVAEVKGKSITLYYDSMKDVSAKVSLIRDPLSGEPKCTPAGIPQDSALFGTKPRLADKQCYWQIELKAEELGKNYQPSKGNDLKSGDWILFGFYRRGTGQVLSGTHMLYLNYPMPDRMYAIDYYGKDGAHAITGFWNEKYLSDPELKELLMRAAGDIFEDSIETSSEGPFWTRTFREEFIRYRNYDITRYLPFVVSTKGSTKRFRSSIGNEKRIQHDYFVTLNDLYINNHVKEIQKWAKSFNYGYRAQAYGGPIDTSGAATVLDVAEGESLGFGTRYDDFRNIAGGVHMSGKKFVSDEVLADLGKSYALTWKSCLDTLNHNFAAGVNRMVIHGASYEKEVSRTYDLWPGWHPFQAAFAEPWGDRQAYWQDVKQMAGYISRNQVVLQNGRPQIDVAVYKDHLDFGQGFTQLTDNGYSYDIISTPSLFLEGSIVRKRILAPGGPGYRALIVNNQECLPLEVADVLLSYAGEGFPIVVLGQVPGRVPGADGGDVEATAGTKATDTELATKVTALLSYGNVLNVRRDMDLINALKGLGVEPSAAYRQPGLLNLRRCDTDGTSYYYFFNGGKEHTKTSVRLHGSGKPYDMDAWTGLITPVAKYTVEDGVICTDIPLRAGESTIIAIGNEDVLGKGMDEHVIESSCEARYVDGKIVARSEEPGCFSCALSGGETIDIMVEKVIGKIALDNWDLVIESWGPGNDPNHPSAAAKTLIDVGAINLDTWSNLTAPVSLLEKAGVDNLGLVSGIGRYTAVLELDEGWTGGYGAYLEFENSDDMVTEIKINGNPTQIDQSKNIVDIGGLLKSGKNLLEMKLVTTLNNRVKSTNFCFDVGNGIPGFPSPGGDLQGAEAPETMSMDQEDEDEGLPGMVPPPPPDFLKVRDQKYGLTRVTMIPYGQVVLVG